jgi:hypothetical protein
VRLVDPQSEVVLIGGRAGVGKSSVANEMHAQLFAAGVWHCLIEGDNLDLAYPPPWEHGLAERNLAMMWRNYRALGYHRLIYTNTVSVRFIEVLAAAMGDDPRVTGILLTCSDATARHRLKRREIGTALGSHIARSDTAARQLDEMVPPTVARVNTEDRSTTEVAAEIITLAGWAVAGSPEHSPTPR